MNRLPIVILPGLLLLACAPENVSDTETHGQAIVGGDPERIKDAPWQVSLQDVEFGHACGGAILDAWNILSARHCFAPSERPERLFSPAIYTVAAGISNLSRIPAEAQVVEVDDIIPLDGEYTGGQADGHDIMVVRLARPLKFGKKVQPIAMATLADERAGRLRPGVIATVTGWGTAEIDGPLTDRLQTVDVPIVPLAVAQAISKEPLSDDLLAAGAQAGRDSCTGDSGGPLTVRRGWGRILAGVVSFGINDACGVAGEPGMYTRVAAYSERAARATRAIPAVIGRFGGIAGAKDQLQVFEVQVPPGQQIVNFDLSGGSGDADLFVRKGQPPTVDQFDCVSDLPGITAELCHFFDATPGTYFVGVIGNNDFAGAGVRVNAYARPHGY
jgi:trypsin